MITGVRGLCNGLGPALYGLIFYLFHVDLNDKGHKISHSNIPVTHHLNESHVEDHSILQVSYSCLEISRSSYEGGVKWMHMSDFRA